MDRDGLDFGDLDPIFKVTEGQRMLKNALSALLSSEGMNGFEPNMHKYIIGRCKGTD